MAVEQVAPHLFIEDVPYEGATTPPAEPKPTAYGPDPSAPFPGAPYEPSDAESIPTLNLSKPKLAAYVDEQRERIERTARALESVQARIAEYGDLTDPATYDRAREHDPDLLDSLSTAERKAANALGSVQANLEAVRRETSGSALVISEREIKWAAERLPVHEKQVETRSLTDIRDLLRLAIADEDRSTQFNLAMLVPGRLKRSATTTHHDGNSPMVRRDLGDDPTVRAEIQVMLTKIRSDLKDRGYDDLHKQADALSIGMSKLEMKVKARKRARDIQKSGLVRRQFS